MPYWRNQFSTGYINTTDGLPDVSASQSSVIVSLLSAGTFFGALTAAPTGDFFGRRFGLIISTMVFTLGVILQTASTAIPMFVAGRFFAGYGVGMISALSKNIRFTYVLCTMYTYKLFQFPCISPKLRPNGSVVPLWALIN
jgi:SP family sugar:H+ symporter-like MFS transporter